MRLGRNRVTAPAGPPVWLPAAGCWVGVAGWAPGTIGVCCGWAGAPAGACLASDGSIGARTALAGGERGEHDRQGDEDGRRGSAVARVRKSAAPRAVIRPGRAAADAEAAAFRALHQDDGDQRDGDERLDDEEEGEHAGGLSGKVCGDLGDAGAVLKAVAPTVAIGSRSSPNSCGRGEVQLRPRLR